MFPTSPLLFSVSPASHLAPSIPKLGKKRKKEEDANTWALLFSSHLHVDSIFFNFFADWDAMLAKLGIHTTTRPNCMVLYGLRVEIYGIGDKLDIGLRDSKWTYSFFIRGLTCAHPWFCLIRPKCLMHSDILGRPIPGEGL